ncbi:MAG: hypothetical protein ACREDL_19975, partial [Bradyrhizobium sp.]
AISRAQEFRAIQAIAVANARACDSVSFFLASQRELLRLYAMAVSPRSDQIAKANSEPASSSMSINPLEISYLYFSNSEPAIPVACARLGGSAHGIA